MTSIPTTNLGLQTPTLVDNSLVGNFNTQSIIQAELQQYEAPITDLQNQQATLDANAKDYQQINADLASLQTAASALSSPSDWQQTQATSSDTAVATATAGSDTPAGSISFTVAQLAAAETEVSSGTVASTSDVVTSSPDFLLSQGAAQIGFQSLSSSGLALGSHTIDVTQASQSAQSVGTVDLASQNSITIGSGNNTVDVAVANGTGATATSYTLTLASGTYSGSSLLTAVQNAITASGATDLQAGYNSSGQLVLSTVNQGSSQSLQVTAPTADSALGTLGLTAMTAADSGVAGIVTVDGTSTTLATVAPDQSYTLTAPTGSVVATTIGSTAATAATAGGGSLLQVGSVAATDISTGNGSLSNLVSNINAAGTGITASAVQTSSGGYVLQLASSQTGVSNDLSVNNAAFSGSSLGTLQVVSAGQNAQIDVGGSGGYSLSSANDTFTGILPGLSITAVQTSTTPVTVTVSPNAGAVAGDVSNLVNAANKVLSDVQQYAGYNEATKQGGPLMGSAVLQDLTNQIQSIMASVSGTSNLGDAKNVGITLTAKGTLSFDQTAFESAYNANPTQVAAMFTEGGTFDAASSAYAGQVSVSSAQSTTQAGNYSVSISQAASQAVDEGTSTSGSVSSAETLTIAMGSTSVDYTTTVGQSFSSVAAGINAALAKANLPMSAQVVSGGSQLRLESDAYGSAASFTVATTNTGAGTTGLAGSSSTAGTPVSFTGTDVAGTIDGVTATGDGQFLSLPTTASSPAAGLSLQVTATTVGATATTLGNVTYSPGIAQSLAALADNLSNPTSGSVTSTISNIQNQATGLNPQIQMYQNIAAEEQKMLTDRYSQLQSTLGSLQDQSSSLSSALSGLATL